MAGNEIVEWLREEARTAKDPLSAVARPSCAEVCLEAAAEIERLQADRGELRNLVATLYCASGCDCCRDTETWEATAEKLARMLAIPPYDDGSGYDFFSVRDQALAAKEQATSSPHTPR